METWDVNEALSNLITGQIRTGVEFVFLDGLRVVKGPFNASRLEVIWARKEWFSEWKTARVVLRDAIPLRDATDHETWWPSYTNIASASPVQHVLGKDTRTGKSVKVLVRCEVTKLREVLATPEDAEWVVGCMLPLLRALVD